MSESMHNPMFRAMIDESTSIESLIMLNDWIEFELKTIKSELPKLAKKFERVFPDLRHSESAKLLVERVHQTDNTARQSGTDTKLLKRLFRTTAKFIHPDVIHLHVPEMDHGLMDAEFRLAKTCYESHDILGLVKIVERSVSDYQTFKYTPDDKRELRDALFKKVDALMGYRNTIAWKYYKGTDTERTSIAEFVKYLTDK